MSGTDKYPSLDGWGNRGWIEIVNVILGICEGGALKTHVLYGANLNTMQVAKYFDLLVENGLIEERQSARSKRPIYTTTPKGRQYVNAYRKLEEVFR